MKIFISLFLVSALLFSCKGNDIDLPEGYQEGDANFSVTQFMEDQWTFYEGQPFLLKRHSEINGIVDSGLQQLDSTFFFHIKKIMDKTDISDIKYLSQYDYEVLEEKHYFSLIYRARDEDLFTQLLVVNLTYENNKILHVYIETQKDNLFHKKTQKITFAPQNFIQIFEYEKSFLSAPKNIKLHYAF